MDDERYEEVNRHCQAGNEAYDQGNYRAALACFQEALTLIPAPIEQWEAATWVLTSIGDTHFLLGEYAEAHKALTRAMYCPDAIGNPFIHLRLGQVQLELGNHKRARDELSRAYMGGGQEIFAEEDPKYYAYIRQFMRGL